MRHEIEGRLPVDRDGVVEAFVAFDELLHGDRLDALPAKGAQRDIEVGAVVDPGGVHCAGPERGLRMSG